VSCAISGKVKGIDEVDDPASIVSEHDKDEEYAEVAVGTYPEIFS